ncbi:MAG: hypothetical protein LBV22_03740 [Mycoplasmataceae bacterium]|jgi:hypothetical protein|nr:hypothetical protein [Mycoplasmataceae bacterium]
MTQKVSNSSANHSSGGAGDPQLCKKIILNIWLRSFLFGIITYAKNKDSLSAAERHRCKFHIIFATALVAVVVIGAVIAVSIFL